MNAIKRYNTLSAYLKRIYGEKVVKLCIDGGFTCPNRDGRAGVGGCIFCGEHGAGENIPVSGNILSGENPIPAESVTKQARAFLDDPGAHPGANKFIAYFQSFSNTYAPVPILKERYDAALLDSRVAVLSVGTRPDCIDEETAALLASYKDRCDIWVELGLQTVSDITAAQINRGYPTARFTEAVDLLRRYGLEVIAHMIIGLPSETRDDVRKTVAFLNRHDLSGVKIHSLYVMEGTLLAELYRSGAYTPLTEEEYVQCAADAIARLSPSFVIHRVTGDCRRALLVAPAWNVHKIRVIRKIDRLLTANNWRQGCLLGEDGAPWET
jgi:radical SAM protein (TIGR01212 family)